MKACLKIINNYFWKSLFGPGILFVFSALYMFIIVSCWSLLGEIKPISIVPTVVSFIVVLNGLFCIPTTINSLRTSIVLKRLGSSKITPLQFITITLCYYFIISLLSIAWVILWTWLIFINSLEDYYTLIHGANFWSILYVILITFILSSGIGLFVLSFTNRNFVILTIAVVIVIFSLIFAGFGAPIQFLHTYWASDNTSSPLYNVVYIDPFWYTSSMSFEAWFSKPNDYFNTFGSSIFNISAKLCGKTITSSPVAQILSSADKALNIYLPISLIILTSVVNSFTFKWNIR